MKAIQQEYLAVHFTAGFGYTVGMWEDRLGEVSAIHVGGPAASGFFQVTVEFKDDADGEKTLRYYANPTTAIFKMGPPKEVEIPDPREIEVARNDLVVPGR